jgi:hypothetical protein
MATYVLVHGGGHGGWCYQRVARILRSAGHDVHTPTLTGLGERSHLMRPGIDLDTHIDDIVHVLHYEDLRDPEQKLRLANEDALWAIPQFHIVCTSTLGTRDPELMEKARANGRLWDVDTGHDLMITEPEFVANALLEIADA